MSGHGREPESPLVIDTWKRWKGQRSISTLHFKLYCHCGVFAPQFTSAVWFLLIMLNTLLVM